MRLSRSTTYAIHALLLLAKRNASGRPVSCKELATEGGLPQRFLLQILNRLARSGILKSVRGVAGGFQFTSRTRDLKLVEVVDLFTTTSDHDESELPVPAMAGVNDLVAEHLSDTLQAANTLSRKVLATVSFADLLDMDRDSVESHEDTDPFPVRIHQDTMN